MQLQQQISQSPRTQSTRVRRSREEWIRIMEEYRQSNCTQAAFCRENELSLATFNKWAHRLKCELSSGFVAVTPQETTARVEEAATFHIRLTLGDGVVLELSKS